MSDASSMKAHDWFFIDPTNGQRKTYPQLELDSAELESAAEPAQIVFADWYPYLTRLVAAVRGSRAAELLPFAAPSLATKSESHSSGAIEHPLTGAKTRLGLDWNELKTSTARLGVRTSGTTGSPRLVWHRLETLTRGVRTGPERKTDIWGMAYHPTHFAGLQVIFQAIANRNPLVRLFGLESEAAHQAIAAEKVSALSATPTFYRLLCTPDAPVHPSVRHVTVGGERYSGGLTERLQRVFPNARIRNIYASSEAGSLLVSDGDAFRIPEQLQPLIRIREGKLEVHAALLADSLKSTAAENTTAADQFVPTGDRVEWLVAGETFKIIGREGEQLNIGGFKVYPGEIEDAIGGFPEVAEVRVYGRPNSVTGMLLCSDIRLHPGQVLTVKEMRRRLGELLPAYKLPGLVNFVDSIAQTYSGKQAKSQ